MYARKRPTDPDFVVGADQRRPKGVLLTYAAVATSGMVVGAGLILLIT